MELIGGIIIGILLVMCLFIMEIYFKKTLLNRLEKKIQRILPREKGAIISLPSEEDRAISEIIQKNQEKGAATYLDELQ
jgi:hypothetical protein